MENKMNLVEILKDCPKGMELDCTISNDVVFEKIEFGSTRYPVVVRKLDTGISIFLTKYGQYVDDKGYKCVIFPKDKTTWEGFVPPCKFKDGDVLFVDCSEGEDMEYRYIFILNNPDFCGKWHSYCHLDGFGYFHSKETYLTDEEYHPRLATEAERQKLFRAMKDNGYKWNTEKKTLEKLIEPKFKVGDRVRNKYYKDYIYDIHDITDKGYRAREIDADSPIIILFGSPEDNYELVPNKFDITTLVPFESRVLVREGKADVWQPSYYGFLNQRNKRFYTTTNTWSMCIPYNEDTKHLIGTTNDCEEFYKTWK